jgi:(4S)-4-hydroxy-5-phosphonooxypentane-2,3-dione isomerase
MPKVALFARLKAKEGKADQLLTALQPLLDQAENEPGTLLYALHRSKDDPDVFWFAEIYADDAAFEAHERSQVMVDAGPALGELIAEFDRIVGEPVSAKGLPT